MRPYLENRTSARDVNCLFSFPLGWCGARVWHRGRWLWWMGGRWRRRSIQHREKGKNPRGGLCNRNCCSEGCRGPAVELAVIINDKWFNSYSSLWPTIFLATKQEHVDRAAEEWHSCTCTERIYAGQFMMSELDHVMPPEAASAAESWCT